MIARIYLKLNIIYEWNHEYYEWNTLQWKYDKDKSYIKYNYYHHGVFGDDVLNYNK